MPPCRRLSALPLPLKLGCRSDFGCRAWVGRKGIETLVGSSLGLGSAVAHNSGEQYTSVEVDPRHLITYLTQCKGMEFPETAREG